MKLITDPPRPHTLCTSDGYRNIAIFVGPTDRNTTVGCPVGCAQTMGTGIQPYHGFSAAHTLCTNDGYRNISILRVQCGRYTVHKRWVQEYSYIRGSNDRNLTVGCPVGCAQTMGTGIWPYPGFSAALYTVHKIIGGPTACNVWGRTEPGTWLYIF